KNDRSGREEAAHAHWRERARRLRYVLVLHAWRYARELRDGLFTLTLYEGEDFGATCARQLKGKVVSGVAPHIDFDMAGHGCEVLHEVDVADSVAGSNDEME